MSKLLKDILEESVNDKYYLSPGNNKIIEDIENILVELKDNNIKSILSEDEIIKLVSGAPFYLQHTIE